jgi:hypothetical protein
MKKYVLIATMAAALSGCYSRAEVDCRDAVGELGVVRDLCIAESEM